MNYVGLCWVGAIFVVGYIVFYWIEKLTSDDLVYFGKGREYFSNRETETINMPINTRYSCQNFCGPTSRCAITGQQCFTDVDCPGCKRVEFKKPTNLENVQGDNSAGKLTAGQTPQYSSLTSGFGTQELELPHDPKPAQANFGVNEWRSDFDQTQQLFNDRYKPPSLEFEPSYSGRYTLLGEFTDEGPLPSNY